MKQFVIILIYLLTFSACRKSETCPLYFELPLQVTPEQSIYNVGDTIIFTSTFHKVLPAYNSSRKIVEDRTFDMEGIFWSPSVLIRKIDSLIEDFTSSVIPQNFEFITNEDFDFQISAGGILRGEYAFDKDTFNLQYQIICKTPGTYFLSQGSYVPRRNGQDFPGRCNNGTSLEVWYKINEGNDNNIDFILESPIEEWHSLATRDPLNAFHRAGGYCFKVE